MNRFLIRMGVLLALAVLGLSMAFYSLERLSLINLATSLGQDDGRSPLSVQLSLFIGLALVNLSAFWALIQWARYVRQHPGTRQAPPWLFVGIFVAAGAAMLWALATHSAWLRLQETVPAEVHWGYIAFQVVAASLLLTSVVLVAVRWSPGYKDVPRTML